VGTCGIPGTDPPEYPGDDPHILHSHGNAPRSRGAPGQHSDNLSLLVTLVGAMEGKALPPFPEVVPLAQALSDNIIGGIVLPHTRGS